MKKYILIFLLSIIYDFAQDKILTTKSDTILAKITSLENQKVVYYLHADVDKKTLESPFASLHKIIWRNGLEYVIDKELEEKLKREVKIDDVKKENIISEHQEINENKAIDYTSKYAPAIQVKRKIFKGKYYLINGKEVQPNAVEKALGIFDSENFYVYSKGNRLRKITIGISFLALTGELVSQETNLIKNEDSANKIYLSSVGVHILALIVYLRGQKIMKKAIQSYELKRKGSITVPRL